MADSAHDYKMQFAALLANQPRANRPASALVIAKQVVGRDTAEKFPMYVIQMSEEWPHDPEVIAEINRLDLIQVPKELVMKDVYHMASDPYKETKHRIDAYRLYAEMNGWIQKSTGKETGGTNEFLDRLQQLHNAVVNPVKT
jgi:hypothetical protein